MIQQAVRKTAIREYFGAIVEEIPTLLRTLAQHDAILLIKLRRCFCDWGCMEFVNRSVMLSGDVTRYILMFFHYLGFKVVELEVYLFSPFFPYM